MGLSSKITISLVFLALLCFSSHQVKAVEGFDYYHLVLVWPAAYCFFTKAACCVPTTGRPKQDFFVHGLWTYNSTTGNPVKYCNNINFNLNQIWDLTSELNLYWTDVQCPSSDGLASWKTTWETYGVCSGLSQHDYVKKALQLRSNIDMMTIFKNNGVVPSLDFFSLAYIKRFIKDNIGVDVSIECNQNMWGEWQLFKIHICVAKDASTIIKCPVLPDDTCGAPEVTFGHLKYGEDGRNLIKMFPK